MGTNSESLNDIRYLHIIHVIISNHSSI